MVKKGHTYVTLLQINVPIGHDSVARNLLMFLLQIKNADKQWKTPVWKLHV